MRWVCSFLAAIAFAQQCVFEGIRHLGASGGRLDSAQASDEAALTAAHATLA